MKYSDIPVTLLGISGSPRKGATSKAVRICLEAAGEIPGVEIKMIDLAGKNIACCRGCNACLRSGSEFCPVISDDMEEEYMSLYKNADALVLGTPVYLMNPTGLLSNFLSRMRPLGPATRTGYFSMRVAGAIAVGGIRNGGEDTALASVNSMLQTTYHLIAGGGLQYYNGAAVWSQNKEDFSDEKGILELQVLGRRLAYSAKVIKAGVSALSEEYNYFNTAGFVTKEQQLDAFRQIGIQI